MYYLHNETFEIIFCLLFRQRPLNIGGLDLINSHKYICSDFSTNKIDDCFNITQIKEISHKPFVIELIKSEKLGNFFTKYLAAFLVDELKSYRNVYCYDKQMSVMQKILQYYFERYGYSFTIETKLVETDIENKDDINKRERILESIIVLSMKDLLTINYYDYIPICNELYDFRNTTSLNINVTLNKSPAEMFDIAKYWTCYGDIRINESDGVAFYKNNKYPFKSVYGKAFKLLCCLVKNHGQKLSIIETFDSIYPDMKEIIIQPKEKKAKIKDYVKEIKKNLKITEDNSPSLDIMIIEDSVLLISNPPIN